MAGDFTFTITSEQLSRGLRPSKRTPRDSKYLVESKGAVGRSGVLAAVDSLTRIATTSITDGFPFPQIFVFTNMIIVCSLKTIYEWDGSTLSSKYTASAAGGTWTAVDFYDYVLLSNGKITVIRDVGTKAYSLSATQPFCTAACNFNGQVLIGSPNMTGLGANLSLRADPLLITTTITGAENRRYWVGGVPEFLEELLWSDTNNWSFVSGGTGGASVPTSDNIAIFDSSSGASICYINEEISCTLVTTGYTGQFSIESGGSLSLSNDINAVTISIQEGGTFTTNGYTVNASVLANSGSAFTASTSVINGSVSVTPTATYSLNQATVNLSDGMFINAYTAYIDTVNIVVSSIADVIVWNALTCGNLTINGTGTVLFRNEFIAIVPYGVYCVVHAITFASLAGSSSGSLQLVGQYSPGVYQKWYLLLDTYIEASNCMISYCNAVSCALFAFSSAGNIDGGNNTGVIFDPVVNCYWVGETGGSWGDTANWSMSSGGAGGYVVPSTIAHVAIFDDNSNVAGKSFNIYAGLTVECHITIDTIDRFSLCIHAGNESIENGKLILQDNALEFNSITVNGDFDANSHNVICLSEFFVRNNGENDPSIIVTSIIQTPIFSAYNITAGLSDSTIHIVGNPYSYLDVASSVQLGNVIFSMGGEDVYIQSDDESLTVLSIEVSGDGALILGNYGYGLTLNTSRLDCIGDTVGGLTLSAYTDVEEPDPIIASTISMLSGISNIKNSTISYIIATGGAEFNAPVSEGNIDGGNNIGWNFEG